MSELRIERLRVEAFRGITASVEIDLRSRLTLLYAANGTGKTTLCDAVEWLFTGRVQRLCENGEFDAALLRAKFARGAEPRVEADLSVDGTPYFLARTPDGPRCGPTADEASPVQPTALLSKLVPDAALDGLHHRIANRRREQYLRATHVLTAEALAALVDTDGTTLARRKEIFADLLDVREELDAADGLRRYREQLQPALAGLQREVEGAGRELAAARAELAGAPDADAFEREAAAAEGVLRLRQDGTGEDRLSALAAEVARRRQELADLDAALDAVDRVWEARRTFRRDLLLAEKAEREAGAALRTARERLAKAEEDVGAVSAGVGRLRHDLRVLREFVGSVAPRLEPLAAQAPSAGFAGATGSSLADLRSAPEARLAPSARLARRTEVRDLVRRAAELPGLRDRLAAAERALSAAREASPGPEALAVLEGESGTAGIALERARGRLGELAEPLEELRAAGRAFLDHDHEGSECPVCGHDWRSLERLRAAVSSMLGRTPGVLGDAEAAVAEANARAVAAGRAWQAAQAAQANVFRQEGAVEALRAEVAGLARDATRLGLGLDRPDLIPALRALGARLDVAEDLSALDDAVGDQGRLLSDLLPGETPVRSLAAAFAAAAERRSAEVSRGLREEEERLAGLGRAREAAAAEVERRAVALERHVDATANLRERQEVFRRSWVRAAGEANPSERARAAARARARQAPAVLEVAEGHLAAARAALTCRLALDRVRATEGRLGALREALARVRRRQAAADRGVAAFEAQTRRLSRDRLAELGDLVNPLFLRMHANRVYDRIDLGGDEADFLRWCAESGGRSFDPSLEFSQGQRQDLAVALFLARALSLRGTFLLDEPVTHLDDLNRIGLLDVLRAATLWRGGRVRLLVTTSSRMLARHLIEKFARVEADSEAPPLRVLEMRGNGISGLSLSEIHPGRAPASRRAAPA